MKLDDELIAKAMEATGLPTVQATIDEALRMLVHRHRQEKATALEAMREGRARDETK